MDPEKWRLFLRDVAGSASSIYMTKFGAHILLSGKPFPHDTRKFPKLKKWQQAAALEIVYQYVKEGKVLGPFPGNTRSCPITGRPLYFYPSFVVPKSKPGTYNWVLKSSMLLITVRGQASTIGFDGFRIIPRG